MSAMDRPVCSPNRPGGIPASTTPSGRNVRPIRSASSAPIRARVARVGQPLEQGARPAVERPVGQARGQPRRRRGVGIDVTGHVQAGVARRLDGLDRGVHLAVVRRAHRLEVRDLQPHPAGRRRAQCLVDRLAHAVALVAHVGRVEQVALGQHTGEPVQLALVRERSRRVDQPAGHPERALVGSLGEQGAHAVELRGARLPPFLPQHRQPQHRVPRQRRDVHSRPAGLDGLGERGEVRVDLGSVLPVAGELPRRHLRHLGRGREGGAAAVAGDEGGDALSQARRRPRVAADGEVGVRVQVDEPGGDDRSRTVQDPLGRPAVARRVDHRDAVADDSHVGGPGCLTGPVDDSSTGEQQVEVGHCRLSSGRNCGICGCRCGGGRWRAGRRTAHPSSGVRARPR